MPKNGLESWDVSSVARRHVRLVLLTSKAIHTTIHKCHFGTQKGVSSKSWTAEVILQRSAQRQMLNQDDHKPHKPQYKYMYKRAGCLKTM